MFTDAELTEEVILSELHDVMEERIDALKEDDRVNVVSTLPGDSWKPSQIGRFVEQAAAWVEGKRSITVRIHTYLGLELVQEKTHDELVAQVVVRERDRRNSANWDEKRAIEQAEREVADESVGY